MPSDPDSPEVVQFLSLDEVLAIHEQLIGKFGGASGIRDHGLLESALFRPQSGYYESLEKMAAALFESLLLNHPFADDNKRVAFFCTDIFLRMNGWKLQVEAQASHALLMSLFENNSCDFDHLLPWIRNSLKKL